MLTNPDLSSQRSASRSSPAATSPWRRSLLVVLIALIGLAMMMNGAVAAPYRQIAFLLLVLPLFLALTTPIMRSTTRRLWRWSVLIGGYLLTWALLQSVPLPFGFMANPVWSGLAELGIPAAAHVSIAPTRTLAALPALILPILVFAAILLLCQEKREAVLAWKALAVLGIGLAALSVLLELVFPETLFFSSVPVGRGAFNGIFVNRNTTAAFLALAICATVGWLFMPRNDQNRRMTQAQPGVSLDWPRLFLGAIVFLMVIALITTRSRAGVSFALICLTLAVAAVFLLRPDRGSGSRIESWAKAGLALAAGVALFALFGDPVASRMGTEADDGRWCAWAGTWQAIRERPLTGFGFATFAEMFPRFRDPDCLGTEGDWTRAHNSHLEFLAGMGAIGAVAALAGLVILARTLLAGVRQRRSLRAIPILSLAALAYIFLHGAADFPLQIPGVALYFAALMGAGAAVSTLSRQPRTPSGRRKQAG